MKYSNIVLTLLLILLMIESYGQKTKRKSEVNGQLIERFYVFKDDPNIKHGEYTLSAFGKVVETGTYDRNKKSGIWEFYDLSGKTIERYDFNSDSITYKFVDKYVIIQPFSNAFWTMIDGKYVECKLEKDPIMKGGPSRYIHYISAALSYPSKARSNGVQGVVYVSATITKDGKLIDEQIEQGLGYGCDEEALRAVQFIPDEWTPGKFNGENVDVKVILPIHFKLG